jgi:DNA invertase Pin-like site-specific DNA recombinase
MAQNIYGIDNAFLYGRKSREDEETLESQMNANRGWANANKVEILKEFVEEGSSSSEDWDRKELQDMIEEIEKNPPDAIIVTEQARICRSDDFPKFREILQDLKVLFVETDYNQVYDYNNANDEFTSDILTAVNKKDLKSIKAKLKRGTRESAKKGNYVGKKPPVGYDYDRRTKRLVRNEHAPIIREMFERYMSGWSTQDIAYQMTHDNILITYEEKGTIKKMVWTSATISRLLNNVHYAGHSLYGKTSQKKNRKTKKRETKETKEEDQILVKNTHWEEAIVTAEEWDRIQEIKSKRNSRPPALKLAKHTFSGFIRCRTCGSIHSFQTNNKNGKKRISSCQTRTYSDDLSSYEVCKNSGANLEAFEILFYAPFKQKIERLQDHIELIKSAQIPDDQRIELKEKDIRAKIKMISQLNTQVNNIQKGFELGIYEGQEVEKANEIKKKKRDIELLEREIKDLKAEKNESQADHFDSILDNMKKFFSGKENPKISERELNEILQEVIEAILYKKEGREIEIDIVWKKDLQGI